MKRITTSLYSVAGVMAWLLLACHESSTHPTIDNQPSTIIDTMPVVKPPVGDSSGTIILPPVNDKNVILPDSAN